MAGGNGACLVALILPCYNPDNVKPTGPAVDVVRDFITRVWDAGGTTPNVTAAVNAANALTDVSFQLHHMNYYLANPGITTQTDRDCLQTIIEDTYKIAPDLRTTVEYIVLSGDNHVLVRSVMSGTDIGGIWGRAATGRPFSLSLVTMFRVNANNKIAEQWVIAGELTRS